MGKVKENENSKKGTGWMKKVQKNLLMQTMRVINLGCRRGFKNDSNIKKIFEHFGSETFL